MLTAYQLMTWLMIIASFGVGIVTTAVAWYARYVHKQRRREQEAHKEAIGENQIIQSLRDNGYHVLDVLSRKVDLDRKTLTVKSETCSQTFDIDKTRGGRWKVFVYDTDGARKVMTAEMFDKCQREVRGHPEALRAEIGFEPAARPSSS